MLLFQLALALLLLSSVAHAQHGLDTGDDQAEAPPSHAAGWGDGRTMHGHRFPFPQFLESSFVVSTFSVHAGIDARRVPDFPTTQMNEAMLDEKIKLETVSATQGIDAAVRVHRLIAVTFDLYGRARVGANTSTLLGTGADFTLGGDAGFVLRLLRTDRLQLSVRASAGYYGGQQAGVSSFYQSVRGIAEQEVTRVLAGNTNVDVERRHIAAALWQAARGLTSDVRGVRGSGSFTAAWAITSYLGLQAMVGFCLDHATLTTDQFLLSSSSNARAERTARRSQTTVGVALDVGGASGGIPLDLVWEYELLPLSVINHGVGQANQAAVQQRLALGLYYSGRTDLQLGASAHTLFSQAREIGEGNQLSGRAFDAGGVFVFRYFW